MVTPIATSCSTPQPVTVDALKATMAKFEEMEKRHLDQFRSSLSGIEYIVADETTMPHFNHNSYMLIIGKNMAKKLGLVKE